MACSTKALLPDELVRTVGRLHWAIYLRGWLYLAFSAVAGAGYFYLMSPGGDANMERALIVVGAVAAFLLLIGAGLLFAAWVRRITTEIVVTDRRVIFKEGFVRRRTMDMNMNNVETVDVVQSIVGRVFDYGTLLNRGTGSSYVPLRLIADPLALRTAIIAQ